MIDFRYLHEIAHLDQVLYRLKVQAVSRGFAERAVVRGERGCGKTEVIQKYVARTSCAYYISFDTDERCVKTNVCHTFFGDTVYDNWKDIFTALNRRFSSSWAFIFLDHGFEEFEDSHPEFAEAEEIVRGNSHILTAVVINESCPAETMLYFYGNEVDVIPRTLQHYCKALTECSKEGILHLYALTGGKTAAVYDLDANASYDDNLRYLLSRHSAFSKYMPCLMRECFRTPESYYPILYSIARGKNRLSEIAGEIHFPYNKTDKYLKTLIKAGFVKAVPDEKKNCSTYSLTGSYFRSWMLYIYPNRDLQICDPEKIVRLVNENIDADLTLDCFREAAFRHAINTPKFADRLDDISKSVITKNLHCRLTTGKDLTYTVIDNGFNEGALLIVPEDLNARFEESDIWAIKRFMEKEDIWNKMVLIFSLHRFSDWCVHFFHVHDDWFGITVERMKY